MFFTKKLTVLYDFLNFAKIESIRQCCKYFDIMLLKLIVLQLLGLKKCTTYIYDVKKITNAKTYNDST